jgi:hypothetical protein
VVPELEPILLDEVRIAGGLAHHLPRCLILRTRPRASPRARSALTAPRRRSARRAPARSARQRGVSDQRDICRADRERRPRARRTPTALTRSLRPMSPFTRSAAPCTPLPTPATTRSCSRPLPSDRQAGIAAEVPGRSGHPPWQPPSRQRCRAHSLGHELSGARCRPQIYAAGGSTSGAEPRCP